MSKLRSKTAPIREKRLGVIGAYSGSLSGLISEAHQGELIQRVRTFAQDAQSDLQYVLDLLGTFSDTAIVVHGPVGCAAALRRNGTAVAAHWLSTNTSERDSILGAEGKLRAAVVQAHQAWSPAAIFVVATPVVAINNDDIAAVVIELSDELSIPVVPVYADGFRSKFGATGYDVGVHALVKHLLPPRPHPRGERINLLSLAESSRNVDALRQLLDELGLRSQVFPRFARLGELTRVVEAKLSVSIEPSIASYPGELLEQIYGVPFLRPPVPLGIHATSRWLEAVAEATGLSALAEKIIERNEQELSKPLNRVREFEGARVFINLTTGKAFAFAQFAHELGLEVVGIKLPELGHQDAPELEQLFADHGDIPVLVGEGQIFEEVNLLSRLKPALYVGEGNTATHALSLGTPVFDLARQSYLGYAGVEALLQGIARKLGNASLPRFLAEGEGSTYTAAWFSKSTNWYIKHETK